MSTTGNVQVTINDNGGASNVVVAAPTLVAVAGCSSAGTANVPISTRSLATLVSSFGYGPLVSLCALLIASGATVIATKLTQTSAGTATAVTATGSGTSVMTVTLDGTVGAFDTYNVKVIFDATGTVGTSSKFRISLDAGRTYGPQIILTTEVLYAIPNTGITLNFAAGNNVVGDTRVFSTVEPVGTAASVTTWLTALLGSPYAQAGWGNMIVHGARTGADVNTIEAGMNTNALSYLFDRIMVNVRDAARPVAWGGAGETEAAWTAAITTDYAAASARRVLAAAGFYNIPEGIANTAAGTPRMRRPLSWAIMARKVAVAVQTLSSRVKDGPLGSIIVDPSNDPTDGFIYHDERVNPGLDALRFASAWTRLGQPQGFYVRSENLMSPLSSSFGLYATGQCFDNFCNALVQYFTTNIDESVRTNSNGTIYENDAKTLESGAMAAVESSMPGQFQPGNTSVVIDRTYNVKSNQKALVNAYFGDLSYIREFDLTAQIANPNAA